ncbi:MAG: hypothetical protein QOI80_3627 [Solirubrobacteraceae bacterium]|nr:hypothetical protein [Solirubrobacteraceae bacterium]
MTAHDTRIWHGIRPTNVARTLTDLADTHSDIERAFLRAIRAAPDVPDPQTNVMLLGYEADCYWPDHDLVAEIDDYATHGDRVAFERDRRKQNRYVANGIRCCGSAKRRCPLRSASCEG